MLFEDIGIGGNEVNPFYYIFNYILYIFKTLVILRATRSFSFYQVQNVGLSSTKCRFIKYKMSVYKYILFYLYL